MTKSTEDKVRDCLYRQLGSEDRDRDDNHNIFNDLGADDLDEIEITMALEDQFEVEIPDNNYRTVKDFIDAVNSALELLKQQTKENNNGNG